MKESYSKEHKKRDWIIVYSGLFRAVLEPGHKPKKLESIVLLAIGHHPYTLTIPTATWTMFDFTHISTISISETFTSGLIPSRYSCSFSVKATAYL